MKRYNCTTCGGELSPYIAEDLFYCNFCGKLYLIGRNPEEESLEELLGDLLEEHSVLEAARKLRLMGKTDVAVALLKDHIAKEGDDPAYIRELLLIDISAFAINEYLFMNRFDGPTLLKIRQDEHYHMLLNSSDPWIKELTSDIELYLVACDQRNEAYARRAEVMNTPILKTGGKRVHPAAGNTMYGEDLYLSIQGGILLFFVLLVVLVRSIPALIIGTLISCAPTCYIVARHTIWKSRRPEVSQQDPKEQARYNAAKTACENAQAACEAADATITGLYQKIERLEKELFEPETDS